jgi:hypothetical protein
MSMASVGRVPLLTLQWLAGNQAVAGLVHRVLQRQQATADLGSQLTKVEAKLNQMPNEL